MKPIRAINSTLYRCAQQKECTTTSVLKQNMDTAFERENTANAIRRGVDPTNRLMFFSKSRDVPLGTGKQEMGTFEGYEHRPNIRRRLSNFHLCPVDITMSSLVRALGFNVNVGSIGPVYTFPSVEHGFHAAKAMMCDFVSRGSSIKYVDIFHRYVSGHQDCPATGADAKRVNRSWLSMSTPQRDRWNLVSSQVLTVLLEARFLNDVESQKDLLSTRNCMLLHNPGQRPAHGHTDRRGIVSDLGQYTLENIRAVLQTRQYVDDDADDDDEDEVYTPCHDLFTLEDWQEYEKRTDDEDVPEPDQCNYCELYAERSSSFYYNSFGQIVCEVCRSK